MKTKEDKNMTKTDERTAPEKEIKELEEENKALKSKNEEYLNGWKRAQADFINYKNAESRRLEDFVKFSNEGLILEMLEIMDDLELAAQSNGEQSGLGQIIRKFTSILEKHGVERIGVSGGFDPNLHEAVGGVEGDKLEEVRAGYIMNGKVIRPTRVKITK